MIWVTVIVKKFVSYQILYIYIHLLLESDVDFMIKLWVINVNK